MYILAGGGEGWRPRRLAALHPRALRKQGARAVCVCVCVLMTFIQISNCFITSSVSVSVNSKKSSQSRAPGLGWLELPLNRIKIARVSLFVKVV